MNQGDSIFSDYISQKRILIQKKRSFFTKNEAFNDVEMNVPFDMTSDSNASVGLLMVHGLFDSPFTCREMAIGLSQAGVWCRSILLPGHGTCPSDLLDVNFQAWQQEMERAIQQFRPHVKQLFLLGYSTGALLCLDALRHHPDVDGLILIAPPLRLHSIPTFLVQQYVRFQSFVGWKKWVIQSEEINAVKYSSLPINPILHIEWLRDSFLPQLNVDQMPPVFMILSEQDETIDGAFAMQWFQKLPGQSHRLLLYSESPAIHSDVRIENKLSYFPHLQIQNFSHCSLCFSSRNNYYGQQGLYALASRPNTSHVVYGAYHRWRSMMSKFRWRFKCSNHYCQELTYNPDFDYMLQQMGVFLLKNH